MTHPFAREPSQDEILEENGHLMVRRAIEREDAVADAVFNVLAGSRLEWTLEDWEELLHNARLDDRRVRQLIVDPR